MEIPENCKLCMYASTCHSWYGGSTCLYKDEIGGENEHQRPAVPAGLSENF